MRLLIGALGTSLGVNSLIWFDLATRSGIRWCGTCFVADVVIPVEIGLLSSILTIDALTHHSYEKREISLWAVPLVGILLTSVFVGIFAFVIGLGTLLVTRQRVWFGWLGVTRSAL
jgi:uncharacterized membrane protein